MALLHVVIGDKNIDEEGSVELEQTRARLVETQNELDRLKETLCQREEDCEKLRQVSSDYNRPLGWRVGPLHPPGVAVCVPVYSVGERECLREEGREGNGGRGRFDPKRV